MVMPRGWMGALACAAAFAAAGLLRSTAGETAAAEATCSADDSECTAAAGATEPLPESSWWTPSSPHVDLDLLPRPLRDAAEGPTDACADLESAVLHGVRPPPGELAPHILQAAEAHLVEPYGGAASPTAFVMLNGANEGRHVPLPAAEQAGCLATFARAAAQALEVGGVDLDLPLRLYSADGRPLASLADIVEHAGHQPESASASSSSSPPPFYVLHLLLDQETWVWGGVMEGFRWTVGPWQLETQSMSPRVILVTDFLSPEQCQRIRAAGEPRLYPSPEKHYVEDEQYRNYRTSFTAGIGGTDISREVRGMSQQIARLPYVNYVEPIQLVRYQAGQWYKQHHDYFHTQAPPPATSPRYSFRAWLQWFERNFPQSSALAEALPGGLQPSASPEFQLLMVRLLLASPPGWLQADSEFRDWLAENVERGSSDLLVHASRNQPELWPAVRALWEAQAPAMYTYHNLTDAKWIAPNRFATLFLYLNDVPEGGETVFPLAQPRTNQPVLRPGMPECSKGLVVTPKQGAGALFYSQLPDGQLDPMSLHGGCPPVEGTKWGANSFMWNVDNEVGSRAVQG